MNARGFTLIEVLVAFAIVGIAMLALSSTAARYLRQSAELRDRTHAHWIAQNRLAAYRLENAFPEPGIDTGDEELFGRRWVWRVTIVPAPGEDDLRRIDVAVALADAPDAPVAVMTGFLGRVSGIPPRLVSP